VVSVTVLLALLQTLEKCRISTIRIEGEHQGYNRLAFRVGAYANPPAGAEPK
jgi:hypothetical protein